MAALPHELDYSRTVPPAIPSTSSVRRFVPNNGSVYNPANNNVINIPINTRGYLDTANSYLECILENKSTGDLVLDMGPSFISRIRLLSAGVVLEDISKYNRLICFLQLAQADDTKTTGSLFQNENQCLMSTMIPDICSNMQPSYKRQVQTVIPTGGITVAQLQQQTGDAVSGSSTVSSSHSDVVYGSMCMQLPTPAGTSLAETIGAAALKIRTGPQETGKVAWSGRVHAAPHHTPFPPQAAHGRFNKTGTSLLQSTWNSELAAPGCLAGSVTQASLKLESIGTADTSTEGKYHYTIPLMTGLFNATHYLPMELVNAGLDLEITLAEPREVGVTRKPFQISRAVAVNGDIHANTRTYTYTSNFAHTMGVLPQYEQTSNYEISNVAYVGHVINLDAAFDQSLRQAQAQSGSIAIHGEMWQHFGASYDASLSQVDINIPVRVKSLKAIFTLFRDQEKGSKNPLNRVAASSDGTVIRTVQCCGQTQELGRDSTGSNFVTGCSSQFGIKSYQYKVGNVSFPSEGVQCDSAGCATYQGDPLQRSGKGNGPAYCEMLRAFGRLGSIDHATAMNRLTFGQTGWVGTGPGDPCKMFCAAYSLDSFQKSVIESGINTADRALNVSLTLQRDTNPLSDGAKAAFTANVANAVTDTYHSNYSHRSQRCRKDRLMMAQGTGGRWFNESTANRLRLATNTAAFRGAPAAGEAEVVNTNFPADPHNSARFVTDAANAGMFATNLDWQSDASLAFARFGNRASNFSGEPLSFNSGSFLHTPDLKTVITDTYTCSDAFWYFNQDGSVTAAQ